MTVESFRRKTSCIHSNQLCKDELYRKRGRVCAKNFPLFDVLFKFLRIFHCQGTEKICADEIKGKQRLFLHFLYSSLRHSTNRRPGMQCKQHRPFASLLFIPAWISTFFNFYKRSESIRGGCIAVKAEDEIARLTIKKLFLLMHRAIRYNISTLLLHQIQ